MQYEEIQPGFTERTITQFENQSAHRQSIENRFVNAGIAREAQGQLMAFVLAIFILALAGYSLYLGQVTVGASIIAGSGVSLVGMFIYRETKAHSGLKEKEQGEEEGEKLPKKFKAIAKSQDKARP